MDEQNKQEKIIEISKNKFGIGLIVILVILIAGFLFLQSMRRGSVGYGTMGINGLGVADISIIPDYPEGKSQPGISDTREFMKVSYNGTIKTRDVKEKMDDVEYIVRSLDGRVDSLNVGEKSGYISFVIAKSDLYEFEHEIEDLVHKKLYTSNTSSRNLLSQKQNIEERTDYENQNLDELQASLQTLQTNHTNRTSQIQNSLNDVASDLDALYLMLASTTFSEGSTELLIIQEEEQTLLARQNQLQRDLSNENSSYNSQLSRINAQINKVEGNLDNLQEEDDNFIENIETVNGTVQVRWVTLWQMGELFSPIPMGINIIILLFILCPILRRLRILPKN